MVRVFCSPSRYVQGRDATERLGAEMSALGLKGPALIVASPSPRRLLEPVWQKSLTAEGMGFGLHPFAGECTLKEIERIAAAARDLAAQIVIGAGGGKVLDAARAAAAKLGLPVVTCPTTAASDAPCSACSVLYTDGGEFDQLLFYPRNPDLVLVDTTVIARAPLRLLVSGMGDALATWFEARTVIEAHRHNQRHGATTLAGEALARLCCETLLADGPLACEAVRHGVVTPALERLVEANTLLSGLGFESGGLAVAHSVHNGLTVAPGTHRYLHGEKVAFGLLVQLVLEGRPAQELGSVITFATQVGLPVTLSQVGLDDPDEPVLRRIAERSLADGETAHNEPFEVSTAMLVDAIVAADAHGGHGGPA
ncbi:MAG: glycerol dehydrogenase [Micromonosporaceae bacterium]